MGRLRIQVSEYYRMGFVDLMHALEGFHDGEIAEMNKLRHLIAAPAWAMGGKISVKQLMPLPIDGVDDFEPVTLEYFKALAKKMAGKA